MPWLANIFENTNLTLLYLVVVSLLTTRRDPARLIQDVDGKFMSPKDRLGLPPLEDALSGKFEAEESGS